MLKMSSRFFTAFLFLLLALALELFLENTFGPWINFALAALIASAFCLSFTELLFLILFSVFVLNWQPAFSLDMLVFAVLPILIFVLKKLIPFKAWLGNLIMLGVGALGLYLILGPYFLLKEFNIFLLDLFGVLMFGELTFAVLKT